MKPTSYVADFDSAAAMLRSLAAYLHGRDFPLTGMLPEWSGPMMQMVTAVANRAPAKIQEQMYIWSGRCEAISPRKLPEAHTERIADWAANLYPRRRYSAVAIGSSNGALNHLWAVLGIPWLPQTFLIPVARHWIMPDEPFQDLYWIQKSAS